MRVGFIGLGTMGSSMALNLRDRFHGMHPPNYNEGTHLITGKGPTRYQVGSKDF
jgi:3-hydroxyisobutyrate dehydrogenase-like beta-hydroxyacid dehydrogenase